MTRETRRDLFKLFGVSGMAIACHQAFGQAPGTPVASVKTTPPLPFDGPEALDNTEDDRRFRSAFNRALRRLRLRGKISRQRFHELRAATFNSFAYTHNRRMGSFLQHIRRDVEQQAGDAWDDMVTAASMFLEALVQWIIESWNKIIGNVLTNLEEWKIAIDAE
jgi:hypothetical protein